MIPARGDGEVCLDTDKRSASGVSLPSAVGYDHLLLAAKAIPCCQHNPGFKTVGIWRMSDKLAVSRFNEYGIQQKQAKAEADLVP